MSGIFGDVHAEPKPGTALRIMVEEHRYLDEFMAMVKAKLELDEKHVGELRALRDSWNSKWVGSGLGPLVSPLLTHLNNEITERENAMAELMARFTALPETHAPNSFDEGGFDPLETLHDVENKYHEYDKAHKTIIQPASIYEIKKWEREVPRDLLIEAPNKCVLPASDRAYRKAVVAQQETVERAVKWTTDNLAVILERHQQRTEDVKSFLNLLLNAYSDIHMGLSTSCSAAVEGNRAFSSSRFIAPRHDEREKEASHALFQTVEYRNYMLDGQVARPLFGLGMERTLWLLNQLPAHGKYDLFDISHSYWMTLAFKLEEEAASKELLALLNSESRLALGIFYMCALFMDTALMPLVGYDIARYQNGVPRKMLSALLDVHLPLQRTEVLTVLLRVMDSRKTVHEEFYGYNRAGLQISHQLGVHADQLVRSIWRKWDIENDRAFPEGVERVWNELAKRSEVIWMKSGRPYYISTLDSSI